MIPLLFSFLIPLLTSDSIPTTTNGFRNLTFQQMILFSFPCPEQPLVDHRDLQRHPWICGKSAVQIPWNVIPFTSLERFATLPLSIISRSLCPSALPMNAEDQRDASADNRILDFPVCVFSLTGADTSRRRPRIRIDGNRRAALRVPLFPAVLRDHNESGARRQLLDVDLECRSTVTSLQRIIDNRITFPRSGVGDESVLC
jgi:hypothetical protein